VGYSAQLEALIERQRFAFRGRPWPLHAAAAEQVEANLVRS
jgi:hypothetical protein